MFIYLEPRSRTRRLVKRKKIYIFAISFVYLNVTKRNNIPDGLSTKKDKISDKLITPQTLLSSSTTTSLWTSALTMVSITENKESNFLQVCTPSNHSFRCSFACLRVTSRLLYVFSAARFCKQKGTNVNKQLLKLHTKFGTYNHIKFCVDI